MKRILITLVFLCLVSYAEAANYTLEIIQPQPALSTVNRFYKAYPGLLYEVNIAVIGGDYPYTYAVDEPGTTCNNNGQAITLDADSGQLSWTPQAADNGCTMSVTVTDAAASTDTVSWTVSVGTAGFIFVDSSVESSGDGTIGSPFKNIINFYPGKADNTYAGYFVYFRTGTYDFTSVDQTDGNFNILYHPAVYLAYPSETPTIDFSTGRMYAETSSTNWYMDGLTLSSQNTAGSRYQQVRISSSGNNVTFRKCTITGLPGAAAGANSSAVMFHNGGLGSYAAFIGNTWTNYNSAYGVLMYAKDKILVADNTVSGITGTLDSAKTFGAKCGVTHYTQRGNTFSNMGTNTTALDALMGGTIDGCVQNSGDFEWSYNNVASTSGTSLAMADSSIPSATSGPLYIHHNTMTSAAAVNVTHDIGPFYFDANVFQNAASGVSVSGGYTGNVHIGDTAANLTGTSGLVDASGLLVNRDYVGTYGWELVAGEADTTAPSTTISESDPVATSTGSTTLTGTSSDAVGVSGCKWRLASAPDANNGTACTGTTSFSCAVTGLSVGANTAYVGCYDAAGNYGSDSITINYSVPTPRLNGARPSGARLQ